MTNLSVTDAISGCSLLDPPLTMDVHQGDCVSLRSDQGTFQVIGVDGEHDRCWVRRWPLARHGCPVFEISLQQLEGHQATTPAN